MTADESTTERDRDPKPSDTRGTTAGTHEATVETDDAGPTSDPVQEADDPTTGPVDRDGNGTAPAGADPIEEATLVEDETTVSTGRWSGALSVALLAGATGLLLNETVVFVSAVVPLAYVAYAYGTPPPATSVAVTRELSESAPAPGDRLGVRVVVENVGDRAIPDLRVVDAVPPELTVLSGSPTACVSLRPGERAELEYAVWARRGEYTFGGTTLLARNTSGATERRRRLTNDRTVSVTDVAEGFALAGLTAGFTGRVPTDAGGTGLEFHSTRQYQRGDPMNRIDWNRYAKTTDLTTVDYRREEAATVVLLVDRRDQAALRRRTGEPTGTELCTHAADLLVDVLLGENDRVGVAFYGEGSYLRPAGGREQRNRLHAFLTDGPEMVEGDRNLLELPYDGRRTRDLVDHLPDDAQVIFLTPLTDDDPVDLAATLSAHDHTVTVVSPDPTTTETAGGTVARVRRADRLRDLRGNRVRVVEWSPDESVHAAVTRAARRWKK